MPRFCNVAPKLPRLFCPKIGYLLMSFADDFASDDQHSPDNASDDEFILEDGELYEVTDDEDFEHTNHPSTSTGKTGSGETRRKNTSHLKRYQDDGDDALFEARMIKLRAQEELDRINKEQQQRLDPALANTKRQEWKEISHDLKLNRNTWNCLFPFQKKGVLWLAGLHSDQVGGILADEMGLGKTVQTLAFLRSLSDTSNLKNRGKGIGISLILCPASLMVQWTKYCHQYIPHARTVIAHNSGSYKGKIAQLFRRLSQERRDGVFFIVPYTMLNIHHKEIANLKLNYVILDEAHFIKNPDLKLTFAIKELETPHKILLTGTPMQNNLKELWSLMDCAYPGRLGALDSFIENLAIPITHGGYANASPVVKESALRCGQILRNAIQPYLLRRTKAMLEDQLNLPEKNEQVLFCELTPDQRALYVEFLQSRSCKRMMDGRMLPFAGLAMLRKICNHPHLVTGGPKDGDGEEVKAYGHPSLSGKLEVTRRLLSLWKKQGYSKVLLFSQSRVMLNIVETMLIRDGHSYMRMDGNTSMGARDGIVTRFNADPDVFVFVLTTRVGGLGLNLTSANKVLIFDPCWNPSTDTQARERAWRIGQERRVTVYRLITSGSLEEKIYHRQLFKEFLAQRVFSKKPNAKLELKTADLRDLFSLPNMNKKGGSDTGSLLYGKTKEKIGRNFFDKLLEKEEEAERKRRKREKRMKRGGKDEKEGELDKTSEECNNGDMVKGLDTVVGLDETEDLEVAPVLTDQRREELRSMAAALSKNLDLLPSKGSKEERTKESACLFEGKYKIPYLVKHTKSKKEKKTDEKKEEDAVMSVLLKNNNVRSTINHDSVLGYDDKRKVEEKQRKALAAVKMKSDEMSRVVSKLRGTSRLPGRSSGTEENSERKTERKRKARDDEDAHEDSGDDLLESIRRRKAKENGIVASFLGGTRRF